MQDDWAVTDEMQSFIRADGLRLVVVVSATHGTCQPQKYLLLQGGNLVMARGPSVLSKGLEHHTATAPQVAPDPSLPVIWESPAPATVPSQAAVQLPTLTPDPFETVRPSLASGSATGPGQPPQAPAIQTGASRDTAAASVTHESLSQHAAPVPLGAPMALRSTPVDWGSPARTQTPMSIPSQASAQAVVAAPSSASAAFPDRADAQTARSFVPFFTSSAAATAPSAATAATEAEAAAAAAPGQQALTDDKSAGKGTYSSGVGRGEGSHASGLRPTGSGADTSGGMKGNAVRLAPEVQAASSATRGIASVQI